MSKLEFQLGDISPAWCEPETSHKEMDAVLAVAICRVVNRRLEEMLRECPEVFIDADSDIWVPNDQRDGLGNHPVKGRLVNVEKIDGK